MNRVEKELSKIPKPKTLKELIDMGFEALEEFEKLGYKFEYQTPLDKERKVGCFIGSFIVKYGLDWEVISKNGGIYADWFCKTEIGTILWGLSDICGQNYITACKYFGIEPTSEQIESFCVELHGWDFTETSSCREKGPENLKEYCDYGYDVPDECDDRPEKTRFFDFMAIVGNITFD